MQVSATGCAITEGHWSGTQQREPRVEEPLHDREGSRARGDWWSLRRTSALALQYRMGKREKAVALQCSCTSASPRGGVPISASEDWQVSWTGRLGGQSDIGLPEDPDIFFLSQSATSPRITQWSLLEGTSGDYLVHPPCKSRLC